MLSLLRAGRTVILAGIVAGVSVAGAFAQDAPILIWSGGQAVAPMEVQPSTAPAARPAPPMARPAHTMRAALPRGLPTPEQIQAPIGARSVTQDGAGQYQVEGRPVPTDALINQVVYERVELMNQQVRTQANIVQNNNRKLYNLINDLHLKRTECEGLVGDDRRFARCDRQMGELASQVVDMERLVEVQILRLRHTVEKHKQALAMLRDMRETYRGDTPIR